LNAGYDIQMLNGDPLNWNARAGDVEMGFSDPPSFDSGAEGLLHYLNLDWKAIPTNLKQW
jgi:hypothetical protein